MSFVEKAGKKSDKPASFVEKAVKGSSTPINLIRCKDKNGLDCYFFIMCEHNKVDAIMSDGKDGRVNLEEYGKVLESGWGKDPSEEIKQIMRDKYDFDPDTMLNSSDN